jgi:uncharacterized membrane protein YcaP (DUF421 family)
VSLLLVVGQTAVIYLFLVVALGRLRRTALTEMTPLGYLITALLGSAVETGLYHGSSTLSAGLVAAATLVVADHATTSLMGRCPRLRRWLVGIPVVLVHDGQVLHAHLRQVRVTEECLRAALRQSGYADVSEVRLAVLEVDGSVGVVPWKQAEETADVTNS